MQCRYVSVVTARVTRGRQVAVNDASFWERSDRNGVSFPEEEGPDPSGVRPWAFALDEGIVT